jgi:hypothetical protein
MGQDGGMGRSELAVSPCTQQLNGMGAIGPVRLQKQPADMVIAHVPDLIAFGIGGWHGIALDNLDNEIYHLTGQPG